MSGEEMEAVEKEMRRGSWLDPGPFILSFTQHGRPAWVWRRGGKGWPWDRRFSTEIAQTPSCPWSTLTGTEVHRTGSKYFWTQPVNHPWHKSSLLIKPCLCCSAPVLTCGLLHFVSVFLFSQRDASHWTRAHSKSSMAHLNYLHLQKSYFQIKLHSGVLGWHEFKAVDTIQPYTIFIHSSESGHSSVFSSTSNLSTHCSPILKSVSPTLSLSLTLQAGISHCSLMWLSMNSQTLFETKCVGSQENPWCPSGFCFNS